MDKKTMCLECEKVSFNYIVKERSQDSYFICSECYGKLSTEKQNNYVKKEEFKKHCEDKCNQTTLQQHINEFIEQKQQHQDRVKQYQETIEQVDIKIKEFQKKQFNIDQLNQKITNDTIKYKELNDFFNFLKQYQKSEDDESTYVNLSKQLKNISNSLELYKYQTSEKELDFSEIQKYVNNVSDAQGFKKYIDSVLRESNLKELIPFCFKRLATDKIEELKQQFYSYYGGRKDNKNHGYGILISSHRVQLGVFIEDSFIWGYMFVMKQMDHYAYSVGYFKDNLLHGQGYWNQQKKVEGRIEFSTYLGEMKFGMRDGFGQYQWPNGTIYEGLWKQNLKHGKGTLQLSKQQPKEVEYVNDNDIEKKIQPLQLPQQLQHPQYPQMIIQKVNNQPNLSRNVQTVFKK